MIEPMEFEEWAAPIVPVDYKVTVNQSERLDKYPLPRIGDNLASLEGSKMFSKLDMAHANQQILLDKASKKLTSINTAKGLYQYTRLPFGVSSILAIFQRVMESILQGVPNVSLYLDDILVTGRTEQEYLETLEKILYWDKLGSISNVQGVPSCSHLSST